ncbi:hypothetical protein, partial [Enterococcus casseliflavus]
SVDRDISDTYFNKMCQRIKAMNYSGLFNSLKIKTIQRKLAIIMGFWYFLTLAVGITLVIISVSNKEVSRSTKFVIACFVLGILLVIGSLLLFLPGSSSVIEQLLQLN